jgi:hypothetical protein
MANNNLTPPEGVQSSAKRALKWIADGKAGGGFTSVGHTRATQLANGESISFSTMKRMKSFFSRHEVDKQAEGFNEGEKGFPSPGRVAWDAWGGNAGFAWVKAKVSEVENSMNKSVDIAPFLIELNTDKLISLHERLHKNIFSPANLEVHHLTTSEMFRRGIKMPIDDEWQDVRLEIDYIEDADLESFGTALPQVLVEDVIKTTGTNIGDVRLILTPFGYAMEIATVEKFNPNHDQVGRFATGSGGSGGSGDNSANSSDGSKFNNLADDLIAGKPAHIDAKDVGKFLETMAKRGDNPDITKLQVNGHTLFGGEGLGIKRKDMPQIPMEMRKQFIQDMADKGISTELKKVNAMDLKPSQSEISATKTARLYEHFEKDGIPTDKAILVSKDGFVVDGHHHWAAAAAMGLMGKNSKIPVIVMDTNIKDALTQAKSWSESHGILAQDLNSAEIPFKKLSNESDYFLKFNPNHDQIGRFATGSGGSGGSVNSVPPMAPDVAPIAERSPQAVAEAKALRAQALRAEPAVTQMMSDLIKQSGGEFATLPDGTNSLEQRIKSTDSLARKIDGDAKKEFKGDVKNAANAVSDALRYTMVVPEATYSEGLAQTVKTMEAAGFKLRTKNFWQPGDPYDGVNIKAKKNGLTVELQVHTAKSFDIKENKLHKILEVYRESHDNEVRRRAWDQMVEIAKSIPKPANYQSLLTIGDLIVQQFETAQQAGLV